MHHSGHKRRRKEVASSEVKPTEIGTEEKVRAQQTDRRKELEEEEEEEPN